MLTILGGADSRKSRHCDGVSRRGFLKAGGMALGGLSLAQLLEVEALAGTGSSHKAVINIYLPGGPSHIDLWDLKPDAPREVRGEFRPVKTNVPGVESASSFRAWRRWPTSFLSSAPSSEPREATMGTSA